MWILLLALSTMLLPTFSTTTLFTLSKIMAEKHEKNATNLDHQNASRGWRNDWGNVDMIDYWWHIITKWTDGWNHHQMKHMIEILMNQFQKHQFDFCTVRHSDHICWNGLNGPSNKYEGFLIPKQFSTILNKGMKTTFWFFFVRKMKTKPVPDSLNARFWKSKTIELIVRKVLDV